MSLGIRPGAAALPRRHVPVRKRTDTARSTGVLVIVLLLLGLAVAAVFAGMLIGSGNLLLLAPIAAVAGLALVLMLPVTWTIWGLFVGSMFIVGPVVYFAKVDAARWITPALGMALFVPLLVRAVSRPSTDRVRTETPAMLWWLGLFLLSVVFSTAIDDPRLGEVINAPRYYMIGVPLLLLLAGGAFSPNNFERAWRMLVWLGLMQLPVAIIQYFVFARRNLRSSPWDAVVGTFPGNSEGGGASAGMGVFLITAFVIALSLWRRGHLKARYMVAMSIGAVLTVALAEVKAVVLLIPVAAALLFYQEIRKKPWQALLALGLSVVLMFGLLAFYTQVQYGERAASWNITNAPRTPLEAIKNQLDPDTVGKWTPSMGRVAALVEWWQQNPVAGDVHHTLFGYGAAATQANKLGVGELAARFRYPLDYTTTGMLLWETGLVGHAFLVIGLLVAAFTAGRMSRTPGIPDVHQALLHAAAVALFIHVITLPYRSFVMVTAPNQILLVTLLGYVAYWAREASRRTLPLPGERAARSPAVAVRRRTRTG